MDETLYVVREGGDNPVAVFSNEETAKEYIANQEEPDSYAVVPVPFNPPPF